jgi:microcystin-dependent protein
MPAHSHGASTGIVARANSGSGQTASPAGNVLANGRTARIYSTNPANVDMDATSISASTTVGATGGSQPANNMQPFLTLQACIVTQGIFPSRP